MGSVERHKMLRQPVAGDRLARLDRKGAPLQAAEIVEGPLGSCHAGQDGSGIHQEQGAGFGQLDAAPDAVEQPGAVTRLKRSDRGAGRRLCKVQRLGRARHMLALGDGDKDAKLFKRHGVAA